MNLDNYIFDLKIWNFFLTIPISMSSSIRISSS